MTPAFSMSLSSSITDAVKDSWAHWKVFMGIPQGADSIPHGLAAMGRLPADEAWVATCTTILAFNAAGVPLRVQVRQGRDWLDVSDTSDGAAEDLQLLVDDVNPEWDGNQLQLYVEAADVVHGGCYVRKVRGRLGGRPQELYWLPATNVQPKKGRTLIEDYEYRADASSAVEHIKPRDIIAFRRFNLADPSVIVSPWEAARWDVTTLRRAAEWNAQLLGNYGIPPGAWVADKDADFEPTELNAIKRALRAIRGQAGAGKVPVLPGGLTWVPLAMSSKDADWIASRKVSRMAVCAIAGVPLVIAGDDEKSDAYATGRDAERMMWRKTLIPKLDSRAARWDSYLVPEFDPSRKRLRIRYDYTGIEALAAPPAEEQQAWQGWVDRGLPMDRAIDRFKLGHRFEGSDEPRFNGKTDEERSQEAEMRERQAEARVRPTEYRVQTGQGREAVRALGARLYRHEAVRSYIDSGAAVSLAPLVDAADAPRLAEGLRRRMSAEQIASAWDDLA